MTTNWPQFLVGIGATPTSWDGGELTEIGAARSGMRAAAILLLFQPSSEVGPRANHSRSRFLRRPISPNAQRLRRRAMSALPQKRTCAVHQPMSALCQLRTSATCTRVKTRGSIINDLQNPRLPLQLPLQRDRLSLASRHIFQEGLVSQLRNTTSRSH